MKLFTRTLVLLALITMRPILVMGQQSTFDAAHQAQQRGDLSLAEAQYRKFLKQQPRSVQVWTNLGVVLAHQGRLAEAIKQYETALRIDPASVQARTDLALAYFRSEQWTKASGSFNKVLASYPDDRRCRQLLAVTYLHLGNQARAASAFEHLLPTDDPDVLVGLATAYKDLGRTADSDRMLQILLASHGDSPTALFLLGMADYSRDSYADAVLHLKKSLDLAPGVVNAHFYLGATYFKQRDFPAALGEWKQAQQLDSNFFPAFFSSGALLIDQHEAQQALPLLQRAYALRPQEGNVQVALARANIYLGRIPEALSLLESGAKLLPDSQPAHFLLARTLKQAGRDREAAVEFARCQTLAAKSIASLIEPTDAVEK